MAKVFVADDNPHVHRIVKETLEAEGHEVSGVADGARVMDALAGARPDLALLDTTLPGAPASAICSSVLERRELDGVRMVVVAGPLEAVEEGDPLEPGVHAVVQKPLDAGMLLDLVRDLPAPEPAEGPGEAEPPEATLESLVSEALGSPSAGLSRAVIREQVEAVVAASMPAIVDRIADRLADRFTRVQDG